MKIKIISTLLFLHLFSLNLFAQNNFDVMSLSDKYGLPQSYEYNFPVNTAEYETVLNLTVPVFISRDLIWYNSLHHYFSNAKDFFLIDEKPQSLGINGFIFRTGIYKRLDRQQRIQVIISPRLMSDFYKADIKSLQLGGIFIYEKVYNKALTLGFGGLYNQELCGPFFSPVLNINWKFSENLYLKGLLPFSFKTNFEVGKNLILGINYLNLNSTYFLSNPAFNRNYIERKNTNLSFFTRFRFFGNFYFEGKAGYQFVQSYKQFEGNEKVSLTLPFFAINDKRQIRHEKNGNAFFVNVSVVFMMNFPEYW